MTRMSSVVMSRKHNSRNMLRAAGNAKWGKSHLLPKLKSNLEVAKHFNISKDFPSLLLFSLNWWYCSYSICYDNTNMLIILVLNFPSLVGVQHSLSDTSTTGGKQRSCWFDWTKVRIEQLSKVLRTEKIHDLHQFKTSVPWLSRKFVFSDSSSMQPQEWKQLFILYLVRGFACHMNYGMGLRVTSLCQQWHLNVHLKLQMMAMCKTGEEMLICIAL